MRGCDVWVNVPRPPLEASGTSGMKSAMNGGLQLSVLDGWWAEALRRHERLGDLRRGRRTTTAAQDDRARRRALPRCSSEEVVPAFYDRDGGAPPQKWVAMMRSSLRTIGPEFGAGRMMRDYAERIYPAG